MTAAVKARPRTSRPSRKVRPPGRGVEGPHPLLAAHQDMELVAWLKTEHGPGHGHANALVAHTLAEGAGKEVDALRCVRWAMTARGR